MSPSPGKLGKRAQGFTLAELLISLAILGIITTFTIPKILTTQQNQQFKAAVKEDIAMRPGLISRCNWREC